MQARVQGRDGELDVGIIGNRIARIGWGPKAAYAKVLVEAEGYQVTPAVAEGAAAMVALAGRGESGPTSWDGASRMSAVSAQRAVLQLPVEPDALAECLCHGGNPPGGGRHTFLFR